MVRWPEHAAIAMKRPASSRLVPPKTPSFRFQDLRLLGNAPDRVFPFGTERQRSFAFARNAMLAALQAMKVGPKDEILLPAYHCVTVVDPVVRAGARCRFYDVDRDLRVDMASLLSALSPKSRALLVIHFFGFPQPLGEIRDLCTSRGIVLIEDCAHALYSVDAGVPLGATGGLTLFSFRKTLPVLGGALLVANDESVELPPANRTPTWAYSVRCTKYIVDATLRQETSTPVPTDAISATSGSEYHVRADPTQGVAKPAEIDDWLYGYVLNPDLNDRRDTVLSTWLIRRFDHARIRDRRQQNYIRMAAQLVGGKGVRVPLPSLPGETCPWAFCIDALGATELDRRLRRRGIPAFTFGEVLHDALPLGEFPDAAYLSANLILLPIHQDLSPEQIEWIAAEVRDEAERL